MRGATTRALASALVAGGLVVAQFTAAAGTEHDRFSDVAGTTHAEGIVAIDGAGVVTGYPDGTFRPAEGVTRGQMATFLAAALDLPSGDASGFSDVVGTTHEDGIAAIVSAGITSGYPDGTYRPGENVTRGQMATFLADGFALPDDDAIRFIDVAGTTHEAGINAVASAGITTGVSDQRFAPRMTVTRGQTATFLARALDLIDRVTPPPELPDHGRDPDLAVEVSLPTVATMDSPTAGAVGPDGTLYLAERAGTVHPLTASGIGAAVVDISDETSTSGERGLLGIAFSDDELFLSYTDTAGDTVLDGVALADDGTVLGDERRTIYTHPQPYSNHNGGQVAVGPDGLVYLGLGDGGGSNDPDGNGQDLTTALGSLIRIDPDAGDPYAVPGDNPFVEVADAAEEIFAYGLRNPWRFSFDRETDVLWIADVGQGQREEINRVSLQSARSANFGWSLMEGTLPVPGPVPDDHVAPVYEYDTHGPEGCAVTGGYVYTGTAIPELRGVYLYADFCNGELRGLVVDAAGEVVNQGGLGVDGGQVVSFVEDADGELYVLDLGGRVSRLEPG